MAWRRSGVRIPIAPPFSLSRPGLRGSVMPARSSSARRAGDEPSGAPQRREEAMSEPVEEPRLHEVADGVFAWVQRDGTWWVNNAGAVAGDGAVFVVDTCATEQRTRRFLEALDTAVDG